MKNNIFFSCARGAVALRVRAAFGAVGALALVLTLGLAGCATDENPDPEPENPGVTLEKLVEYLNGLPAGNKATEPYIVILAASVIIDNSNTDAVNGVWALVNKYVKESGRYVILNLSRCTFKNNTVTGAEDPVANCMNIIKDNECVKGVILPETVTTVGDNAFNGCSGLNGAAPIPGKCTGIGNNAYKGCSGLSSASIPGTCSGIGSNAFNGCSGLKTVNIPANCTIGKWAFNGCSGLTSLIIPEGVTVIDDRAFSNCSQLTSVTIPNSVTKIGYMAFSTCSGLTSITIPENVTTIGASAFDLCTELATVTIKSTSTSIGDYAFSGCDKLIIVTFATGSTITTFGDEAFPSSGAPNALKTAYTGGGAGKYTRNGATWTKEAS